MMTSVVCRAKNDEVTESVEQPGHQQQKFVQSESMGTHNPLDWNQMPAALQQHFPHWKQQEFHSPDNDKRILPLSTERVNGW